MLGESIRRRSNESRRWLPYAAAAGWLAFCGLLLFHIATQLQHSRYQRQVATEFFQYRQQVEMRVRVAMQRAETLERELVTCSSAPKRGGLLSELLPTLLTLATGTPPSLSEAIADLIID